MRRRELIGLIGATAATAFLRSPIAGAQKFDRPKLIAVVGGASAESARPQAEAIVQGLRDLGYAYGIDYEFAPHWANGDMRRLPALAQDALRLNPDVIMAAPTQAAVAIKAITATIPIICFMLVDEVRLGLVASDARPDGNVTGLAMRVDGLAGKQIEIATEISPAAKKIGILVNTDSADAGTQLREVNVAGAALKIERLVAEVRKPEELEAAFGHLVTNQVESVVVLYDALFFQERRRVASMAAAARLPSIFSVRDFVNEGGLASYGISLRSNAYRSATYLDKIFKGSKPGDLPVEFPTTLELVINLKTAKALGITVPARLLARDDEVIE